MLRVQVSFNAGVSNLDYRLGKIKEILENESIEYKVVSLHLNRKILLDMGLATIMIDSLENVFGEKYRNMCIANSFEEHMNTIDHGRRNMNASKIFVVMDNATSIFKEIEASSDGKIVLI